MTDRVDAAAVLALSASADFLGNASFAGVLRTRLAAAGTAALLVLGPSGCGKSALVKLLCGEADAEVRRLSTDDVAAEGARGLARRLETLRDTRSVSSFFNPRRRVVLVDDVDAMHAMDRLTQGVLLAFVRDAAFAASGVLLVMTASDERKLTELKRRAEVLRMAHPPAEETVAHLARRLRAAGHEGVDEAALAEAAKAMGGAVRATLLQYTAKLDAATGHGSGAAAPASAAAPADDAAARGARLELALRDCGVYDVLAKVLAGEVQARDSDTLTAYDPTVMALLYYDNVARHVASAGGAGAAGVLAAKRRLAWPLHQMHVLECNTLFGGDMSLGDLAASLRCKLMCTDAQLRGAAGGAGAAAPRAQPEYAFTQILARTAQKYHVEKRTHALLHGLGLGGAGSRECYYDACAAALATPEGAARGWPALAAGDAELGEQLRQLATPYCEHVGGALRTALAPPTPVRKPRAARPRRPAAAPEE